MIAPGDVVAWRRAGGWAFGVVESVGRSTVAVRVIAGSPSKTASRPFSGLVRVMTAAQYLAGLEGCLRAALDEAPGPGADRAERQ